MTDGRVDEEGISTGSQSGERVWRYKKYTLPPPMHRERVEMGRWPQASAVPVGLLCWGWGLANKGSM